MGVFVGFEREVIRRLMRGRLPADVLEAVLAEAELDDVVHTGVGYFVNVRHPALPLERVVCDTPPLRGEWGGQHCGFEVFLMEHELTLECFMSGDECPQDIRERDVRISLTPMGHYDCGDRPELVRVDPKIYGSRLWLLMQAAYAVERELLGAADFPPLDRSVGQITDTCAEVLVIIRQDEVLAALELESASPDSPATIASLVVDPGHFRRGFGRRLVRFAREHVEGPLRVGTASGNAPALALYAGLGFRRVGAAVVKQGIEVVTLEHPGA